MKRAVRKLLQARPNTMVVTVKPYETDFAEFGKCKQNSYNLVHNDSDRFEFVTGWVVHEADGEHTIVHGHWWNYDTINNEHIDSTQKFFKDAKITYVVDMDIGRIISKYQISMGDKRLELLFDKHPQVIGDLLFYNDDWYAWDDEEQKAFHNFGKTVDAQQLFAMDMMLSAEKIMKPEVFQQFKDYLGGKHDFNNVHINTQSVCE